MHLRFLLGGTGNQIFQIATSSSDTKFSSFFLNGQVCKILRLTHHEDLKLVKDVPLILNLIALPAVALDVFLYWIFSVSIFTDFDLNRLKGKSLFSLLSIGYFQNFASDTYRTDFFSKYVTKEATMDIVLHLRAGDYLTNANVERFGKLPADYFSEALRSSYKEQEDLFQIVLASNDKSAAEQMQRELKIERCQIEASSLESMIKRSLNSFCFIASNSTLSYWIAVARSEIGRDSIVPKPFQKSNDFCLPKEKILEIPVEYRTSGMVIPPQISVVQK